MSLKIREIELPSPIVIAPMAGVSTRAFRRIAREFGAGLVCNEMVSDKALYYDSARTRRMLACEADDHPVSFQIFGHDIDTIVHAAKFSIRKPTATSSISTWGARSTKSSRQKPAAI